ncbi:hypothetical protein F4776DRAFT_104881 [Hypoxylon sp. NC0597]|nr:hypothetical protein F4776DRAFT_104881 [Hypoxylon sp. NC0597]
MSLFKPDFMILLISPTGALSRAVERHQRSLNIFRMLETGNFYKIRWIPDYPTGTFPVPSLWYLALYSLIAKLACSSFHYTTIRRVKPSSRKRPRYAYTMHILPATATRWIYIFIRSYTSFPP